VPRDVRCDRRLEYVRDLQPLPPHTAAVFGHTGKRRASLKPAVLRTWLVVPCRPRSFAVSAPATWDAVPLTTCHTQTFVVFCSKKGKGSPYSITERRVPELIPVLGSQPAGGVSHKPGGRLPLLSARPAITPATLKRAATNFAAW